MSKHYEDDDRDEAEEYEEESPRRGKAKESAGSIVLRFISPSTFLIAAVLFFLPWTDLSCRGAGTNTQIAVQSGLQSATGDYSEGSGIADLRKQKGGPMGGPMMKDEKLKLSEMKGEDGGKTKEPDKAPILWLYLGLLILAAIVPPTMGAGRMRGIATITFAGLTTAVLAVQLSIGMPFANWAKEQNREIAKELEEIKGGAGGNVNMFGDPKAEFQCNFLPSYWITFVILAVGAVLGFLQIVLGGAVVEKPRRRSRRRRDEDDDEEDD